MSGEHIIVAFEADAESFTIGVQLDGVRLALKPRKVPRYCAGPCCSSWVDREGLWRRMEEEAKAP